MVVVGAWVPLGAVAVVVCEMIALFTLSSNSVSRTRPSLQWRSTTNSPVEVLLGRQIRIGEGRYAADR
jgi:hypothetical protein